MFLGEVYRIPGGSMKNTLFPEDVVVVNKLTYGPRLPRSPFDISWVNLLFYLNKNSSAMMKKNWWPYRRLNGFDSIRRGDILVYEPDRTFFMAKRCVAIAGDTLSMVQGIVQVNGSQYLEPQTIVNTYSLKVKNKARFYKYLDSAKVEVPVFKEGNSSIKIRISLSNKQSKLLKEFSGVKDIDKLMDSVNMTKELFAMPIDRNWTLDDMGPFVIPKKGMKIVLNQFTFNIYNKTLSNHEGLKLRQMSEGYYDAAGKKISSHTFSKDYFFMIGDNRKDSKDSRYFGFVPEEYIVGKVHYVLFSNYKEKFAWNRVLRKIRVLEK